MTKESILSNFEVQELPTFSIKRFNLQNVLDFNNTRPEGDAEGGQLPRASRSKGHPRSEITKKSAV